MSQCFTAALKIARGPTATTRAGRSPRSSLIRRCSTLKSPSSQHLSPQGRGDGRSEHHRVQVIRGTARTRPTFQKATSSCSQLPIVRFSQSRLESQLPQRLTFVSQFTPPGHVGGIAFRQGMNHGRSTRSGSDDTGTLKTTAWKGLECASRCRFDGWYRRCDGCQPDRNLCRID